MWLETRSFGRRARFPSAMSFIDELALRAQAVNLNAGPSPLPLGPLLEASRALISFAGSPGLGIAEISHRSPAFAAVMKQANADLRQLLEVPANYRVLWMQGGGLTQFSATALNLLAAYRLKHQLAPEEQVVGEYVVTGSWSLKAAEEGARMGAVSRTIVDGRTHGDGMFTSIPPVSSWDLASAAIEDARLPAFVYYCENETVDGVEFPADASTGGQPFPFDSFHPDVPIVCDMSSNFLSRPVDVSKYGVIYAGAQKNLGPAGVSIVIVREDLLSTSCSLWCCANALQSTRTSRCRTEGQVCRPCSVTKTWPTADPCTSTSPSLLSLLILAALPPL